MPKLCNSILDAIQEGADYLLAQCPPFMLLAYQESLNSLHFPLAPDRPLDQPPAKPFAAVIPAASRVAWTIFCPGRVSDKRSPKRLVGRPSFRVMPGRRPRHHCGQSRICDRLSRLRRRHLGRRPGAAVKRKPLAPPAPGQQLCCCPGHPRSAGSERWLHTLVIPRHEALHSLLSPCQRL